MSWDRQKAILEGRLRELEARLGEIETSLDAPKPLDWDDSAIEREGDEVLEELGVQGLREIAQIPGGAAPDQERRLRRLCPLRRAHRARTVGTCAGSAALCGLCGTEGHIAGQRGTLPRGGKRNADCAENPDLGNRKRDQTGIEPCRSLGTSRVA